MFRLEVGLQKLIFAGVTTIFLGLLLFSGFQNCGRQGFQSSSSTVNSNVITVNPPPPPVTQDPRQATFYQPILADRIYLSALFTDIFGSAAINVNTANTAADAVNNGSPCSIYEDYNVYDTTRQKYVNADPTAECRVASENLLAAQSIPNATVTRQALLVRACSDLTSNPNTFNFALAKIDANQTNVDPNQPPDASKDNLTAAFHLFYRTQPDPSPALLQSLQLIFPPGQHPSKTAWRNVIYTICISSYWQVL